MPRRTEYITSGTLENGDFRIRNRPGFERAVAQMADGEYIVTIAKRSARRSYLQNAYWFGVCVKLVSDHTGYTPDEVHEIAKQMFLPKRLAVTDGNGEVHGEFVVGGSTTRLNRIEFSEFVEQFRKWAGETLGVVIPDPDPDWREKAERESAA